MSGGRGGERNGCRWGGSITHQDSISCTTEYISHQHVSFIIHLHEQKLGKEREGKCE